MFVNYRREGRIAVITLNRPDRKNSIGQDMLEEMEQAWAQFKDDPEAWIGVLVGEGPAFCAGRDVKGDMTPLRRTDLNEYFVPDTDKPLIVGVRGHVIGLGWYMAAGCDYVVAGDDARFWMSQLRVGLPGPYNFGPRLNMTPALAFETMVLGHPLSAERAYELGFVNDVRPADQVEARALEIATELLDLPPGQTRLTKRLLRATDRPVPPEVKAEYWEGRKALEEHPDTDEVRAATREKRKPSFVG